MRLKLGTNPEQYSTYTGGQRKGVFTGGGGGGGRVLDPVAKWLEGIKQKEAGGGGE